jgi:hypothetical protein
MSVRADEREPQPLWRGVDLDELREVRRQFVTDIRHGTCHLGSVSAGSPRANGRRQEKTAACKTSPQIDRNLSVCEFVKNMAPARAS